MSWFQLKDQGVRRYRKGVWLRVRALPDGLRREIERHLVGDEEITWVVIKELRGQGRVLLEVWCWQLPRSPVKTSPAEGVDRFTVFHVEAVEDPEWVCEGDLGRGLVAK